MAQELNEYTGPTYGGPYYDIDEVDAVLAEKDATIGELNAKLENVNELVKAANKFVDDLKNSDCSKKDEEIKSLKKSVQFFSDLHHNESESAKECFRRLMDLGLIEGWGLTKKFFVMPKYTKERLAQFEKQDAEIRRLKRALWIAHEYKAKFKRWWLHLALDYEASMIRPNTKTINRIRGKIGNCEKSERKCRAKAEEFK